MNLFGKKRLKETEKVMEQYVVRLYRGLGTSLAGRLVYTGITPNEITLVGFIFVLIACFFFTRGTHI
ncbi:MAG: hypothetical protein HQ579_00830, partial [Candidatus Omnitrophica bacterium]|nr:hypothetical protein [Candidatus Omnitrophota bacterium]